jgi:hypothetical protein
LTQLLGVVVVGVPVAVVEEVEISVVVLFNALTVFAFAVVVSEVIVDLEKTVASEVSGLTKLRLILQSQ